MPDLLKEARASCLSPHIHLASFSGQKALIFPKKSDFSASMRLFANKGNKASVLQFHVRRVFFPRNRVACRVARKTYFCRGPTLQRETAILASNHTLPGLCMLKRKVFPRRMQKPHGTVAVILIHLDAWDKAYFRKSQTLNL